MQCYKTNLSICSINKLQEIYKYVLYIVCLPRNSIQKLFCNIEHGGAICNN